MENSGIYKIVNLVNDKIYVGSAVNFKQRKSGHFSKLNKNTHHSIILQRAYNKYGKTNFKFEVIEYCDKNVLLKREQYYIDTLNPYYNICKIATSRLGVKASKETIEKLKISHMGIPYKGGKKSKKTKEKLRLANLGKKHSKESIEKMRNANLGRKQSPEHIINAAKARQIPIVQLGKNGNYIDNFNTATQAGEILKIERSNITRCCRYNIGLRSIGKTAGGYKWMYKKDYDKLISKTNG